MADFQGRAFHSAEWPETLNLKDKRAGVVGTGASAVQLIPEVARAARSLVVLQRQAPYALSRDDRAFTFLERRLLHW
jgi:cation diffusion facilitator CzcD-associated flavoprotein CzcO